MRRGLCVLGGELVGCGIWGLVCGYVGYGMRNVGVSFGMRVGGFRLWDVGVGFYVVSMVNVIT